MKRIDIDWTAPHCEKNAAISARRDSFDVRTEVRAVQLDFPILQ